MGPLIPRLLRSMRLGGKETGEEEEGRGWEGGGGGRGFFLGFEGWGGRGGRRVGRDW